MYTLAGCLANVYIYTIPDSIPFANSRFNISIFPKSLLVIMPIANGSIKYQGDQNFCAWFSPVFVVLMGIIVSAWEKSSIMF